MRDTILVLLRARFGALPPELEQAIGRADRAALETFTPFVTNESLE